MITGNKPHYTGHGNIGEDRRYRTPPPSIPGWYVTEFVPHKALKCIACGKLTFDDWVVVQRVEEATTATATLARTAGTPKVVCLEFKVFFSRIVRFK